MVQAKKPRRKSINNGNHSSVIAKYQDPDLYTILPICALEDLASSVRAFASAPFGTQLPPVAPPSVPPPLQSLYESIYALSQRLVASENALAASGRTESIPPTTIALASASEDRNIDALTVTVGNTAEVRLRDPVSVEVENEFQEYQVQLRNPNRAKQVRFGGVKRGSLEAKLYEAKHKAFILREELEERKSELREIDTLLKRGLKGEFDPVAQDDLYSDHSSLSSDTDPPRAEDAILNARALVCECKAICDVVSGIRNGRHKWYQGYVFEGPGRWKELHENLTAITPLTKAIMP